MGKSTSGAQATKQGEDVPHSLFGVSRCMPEFGAKIEGIDLSGSISAEVRAELRKALLDYGVLFFAHQRRLSLEQHLELTRVFGSGPSSGNEYLPRHEQNTQVELLVTDAKQRPYADRWHSDLTWKERPPFGTIIQIQEMPDVGGNTAWASTHMAWNCLSDAYKRCLEGMAALHTWEVRLLDRARRMEPAAMREHARRMELHPPVAHPIVMAHPVTGRKAIYVNETFTRSVPDVHPLESESLLRFLFDWIRRPEFQLHHRWEVNGVAVWDNYATQHYALSDYWPARRVNQRVTFEI